MRTSLCLYQVTANEGGLKSTAVSVQLSTYNLTRREANDLRLDLEVKDLWPDLTRDRLSKMTCLFSFYRRLSLIFFGFRCLKVMGGSIIFRLNSAISNLCEVICFWLIQNWFPTFSVTCPGSESDFAYSPTVPYRDPLCWCSASLDQSHAFTAAATLFSATHLNYVQDQHNTQYIYMHSLVRLQP